jgi:two-component system OmpR family sensor kinase
MTLRARVLFGGLVIAVVLAGAALVITRITEAYLIERVDRQLEPQASSFERCGGATLLFQLGVPPDPEAGSRPELDTHFDGRIVGGTCDGDGGPPRGAEDDTDTLDDTGTEDDAGPSNEGETETGPSNETGTEHRTVVNGAAPVSDPLIVVTVGRVTPDRVVPIVELPAVDGAPPAPEIDPEQAVAAADDDEAFTTGSSGSDTRWRVRAVVDAETGQLMVVAQSLADVDAVVERLIAIEIAATLAILAALGMVAWWVDRHGIRPVKRMTTAAAAIAAGDLSHRVPEAGAGTEAGRLGMALNRMLARIEQSFDERSLSESRLRQFVADASHELRTPVTTIRGYSELYDSGGLDDPDELSEAMRRTRQETLRMGNLVDDMLLLARLDQGPELARTRVDLAALARDAGRDAQAVDPSRVVVVTADGQLDVLGDRDRLRQVLANLVGNALVHTPSSAAIDIRAGRDGDNAVVEIADRGPGMPTEVADHAFERFFRADPSRSRHRGGSGLGLAIVDASVAAHDGEVSLDSTPGQGTTARVALPLA